MHAGDPFHDGERCAQEQAGERAAAARTGTIVASVIAPGARPFLAELQTLAIATLDERGGPSASVLFGPPGFVTSGDGQSVLIRRNPPEPASEVGAWPDLRVGSDVGLLAIDLATRRRFRVNGVVHASNAMAIEVAVREAYPNCRKYVQMREVRADDGAPSSALAGTTYTGDALDDLRSCMVAAADTFFVASRHPVRGADISHRGGAPGFVRVVEPRRLRVPDYPGNSMFNTLGNLLVDDRAALAFLDFERGRLLQMSGSATVMLNGDDDPRQPTGGTGRYWDFHVTRWIDSPIPSRIRWGRPDPSPHNPKRAPGRTHARTQHHQD